MEPDFRVSCTQAQAHASLRLPQDSTPPALRQGSGGALNSQPEANASVLLGTELHQHRDDQHPRLVVASDSAEISGSDVLPVLFFQGRAPRSATIMISRLDQIIA